MIFCGITCKWVLFPTIDLISISLHRLLESIHTIDSFPRAVKTAIEVQCLCASTNDSLGRVIASTSKNRHLSGFFGPTVVFVCARRNQLDNLAFRSTIIEDTHLTLAAIPCGVEGNYSLILNIQEKNLPNFLSFIVYNSLVCVGTALHISICTTLTHVYSLFIVFF